MADNKKYVDHVVENKKTFYIKDTETSRRVDDLEEEVETLKQSPGDGNSESSRTIINVNDDSPIRLWVGSSEQFAALTEYEPDVVYLIGTPTEGYVPPDPPGPGTTYYTITKGLSHCSFSNGTTRVEEGSPFTGTLSPEGGYTLSYVRVSMYDSAEGADVDITDDCVSYRDDDAYAVVSISSVTGNVTISAGAIIPLRSIIISRNTSADSTNRIALRASLVPEDTTQRDVRWSIPDSATDFALTYSGLDATIRVKETADDSSVDVTCYLPNSSVSSAPFTLQDVTYDDGGGDVPSPDPDDEFIDFASAGENDILALLIANGWKNTNGRITKADAMNTNGISTTNQQKIFRGTSITKFNTWKYFTTARFSVENCTSLTEVTLPLLSDTSTFSKVFGIANTALTEVIIPEGYRTIALYNGGRPFTDGTSVKIQSITFPSSLESISAQFYYLTGITELDFSDTSLSTISLDKQFEGMSALTTVKFPDTMASITGVQTFKTCTALERVEFGTGFTSATNNLFYDSTGADITLVFHGTTPPTSFNLSNARIKSILVPASAVNTYKNSTVFSSKASIIDSIPENNG